MDKKELGFFNLLRLYGQRPEITGLWLVLLIIAIAIALNVIFPSIITNAIIAICFIGLGFFVVKRSLDFVHAKSGMGFKTTELKAIIENLKDGVLMYDTNFKILSVNRAAEEIFNIEAKAVIGKIIEPGLIKNPGLRVLTQVIFPSLAPSITQISDSSWPQIVDITIEDPPLQLRTVLNRLTDENGRATGFIKLVRDQTRERSILRSKSEFIAVAAHQLRTPLTAIHWAFEHLLENEERPELKKVITEGYGLAGRSLKIINDLLEAAKIEGGQFGYAFEDFDLNELVQKAIEQAKPIAKEYNVRLYFSGPQEKIKVRVDLERLSVAILNLLDNAIKYNIKDGSVSVVVESIPNRPFVKISIRDTGLGVPKEDSPRLFTKFYRGGNIIQVEPNGSGLGLYIVKNVIQRHGGEIGADSTIGRGSTFWFTLPTDPSLIPSKEIIYEERV